LVTAETVNVAVALVRPGEKAAIVAVPDAEGVKLVIATPLVGLMGPGGLKVPETPLTEKLMGFVAEVTVLPLAS
jgi:hypothetical protein